MGDRANCRVKRNPMSVSSVAVSESVRRWRWRGYSIGYYTQGDRGAAVVLVHGFGASWGHWRKNIPALAQHCRVWAIDLLGFGASDKPAPSDTVQYTFETWSAQIADFCREVVGGPAFLVGNSIGCIAVMQTAVSYPDVALGVAAINCSLRLLHDRRRETQSWLKRVGAPAMQRLLGVKPIGNFFFKQLAKPKTVERILLQAYRRSDVVTEELVDMILTPARDAGASAVFIAFTRYSQGPLPEELLEALPCPAILLWGTEDPWEPIALGRELAKFDSVERFIPLEGVGHCPQDEAPELVNPVLLEWILEKVGEPTG
jgi:pimeloyl-ACP methyl ester carboxylesterase